MRAEKSESSAVPEDHEYLVDDYGRMACWAQLGVGIDGSSLPGHFRMRFRYDTSRAMGIYEYRLEGPDVLYRLIDDRYEDIGVPEEQYVRDGVVLEAEIRTREEDRTPRRSLSDIENKISDLKADAEWHVLKPVSYDGLKYFIQVRDLPQVASQRYLQQELERLKTGEAGVFKEAEKYGLEADERSRNRLKLKEGRPPVSPDDLKSVLASAQSYGLTEVEFLCAEKLTGLLERLLVSNKKQHD